jgi:hypothetical protein
LDALGPRERVQALRGRLRPAATLRAAALAEAGDGLREAKALHDEIEAIYNPHVDFDGLYALCGRHVEMLLK